ncbi:hypothetical protein ACS0TY_029971 [Phlomoides rotata]
MEIGCVKWTTLIMLAIISACSTCVAGSPQVTALFAFGDSLTDPGNNNYLNSIAKANYVPYGIDFNGPSGRFCNGKTVIDYLGELLEIHVLPAYTSPLAIGKNILEGMNYASAAGGILEETGQNLGERFSLSEQVVNFEITLNELRRQMEDGEFSYYLGKAIVVMTLGSNDYINNYLQHSYTSSYLYTPQDYTDLLINRYATQILAVERLGVRKFFLGGIGPLGCIPNQLATRIAPPAGKCIAYTNDIVNMFNKRLASLVDELNHKYNGSIFAYANTFGVFNEILNNAKNYGFDVTDRGCCGIGRNQGQIT